MTTQFNKRPAIGAMYAGLGLTVATIGVTYGDHATANVLAAHIRSGYPTYSNARIDSAVAIYLVYLTVIGALGMASWLGTIWAVKAGKWWARGAATAMLVLGATIVLTDLLIRDTSGATGLPPLLGWVGLLPCMAGVVAVVLLWTNHEPS